MDIELLKVFLYYPFNVCGISRDDSSSINYVSYLHLLFFLCQFGQRFINFIGLLKNQLLVLLIFLYYFLIVTASICFPAYLRSSTCWVFLSSVLYFTSCVLQSELKGQTYDLWALPNQVLGGGDAVTALRSPHFIYSSHHCFFLAQFCKQIMTYFSLSMVFFKIFNQVTPQCHLFL